MIVFNSIPFEEGYVRALNGEKIFGCFSDGDTTWYINLKNKSLFKAFTKEFHNFQLEAIMADTYYILISGERVDLDTGRYIMVDSEYCVEIKTVEEFNHAKEFCI